MERRFGEQQRDLNTIMKDKSTCEQELQHLRSRMNDLERTLGERNQQLDHVSHELSI